MLRRFRSFIVNIEKLQRSCCEPEYQYAFVDQTLSPFNSTHTRLQIRVFNTSIWRVSKLLSSFSVALSFRLLWIKENRFEWATKNRLNALRVLLILFFRSQRDFGYTIRCEHVFFFNSFLIGRLPLSSPEYKWMDFFFFSFSFVPNLSLFTNNIIIFCTEESQKISLIVQYTQIVFEFRRNRLMNNCLVFYGFFSTTNLSLRDKRTNVSLLRLWRDEMLSSTKLLHKFLNFVEENVVSHRHAFVYVSTLEMW